MMPHSYLVYFSFKVEIKIKTIKLFATFILLLVVTQYCSARFQDNFDKKAVQS